jgi:outer membrane protein assembly factor BamB
MSVKPPLIVAWEQELPGGRLTAPTMLNGNVLVASIDAHTVHCLDAETGKQRWRFIAGGRIDTPPTLHQGRAVFGARDGCLYSVDLETGRLAWSLDLNPGAPRVHAFGQLESVQPLHGSVLVHGDHVYALAGRCSLLDGGLGLFRVRADDGTVAASRRLVGAKGSIHNKEALLPDLLTAGNGGFILRHRKFSYDDLSDMRAVEDHLWSPVGFLDDQWHHRNYWVYGTQWGRTWPLKQKRIPVPAGRLLCVDAASGTVYGFGRNRYGWGINPENWQSGKRHYHLHATPLRLPKPEEEPDVRRGVALPRTPSWSTKPALEARAMVATGRHVLIAGPKGDPVLSETAARGGEGSVLQVFDRTDGALVQNIPLPAMPVYDGLAAAGGRIIVALKDGRVVSLAPSVH